MWKAQSKITTKERFHNTMKHLRSNKKLSQLMPWFSHEILVHFRKYIEQS